MRFAGSSLSPVFCDSLCYSVHPTAVAPWPKFHPFTECSGKHQIVCQLSCCSDGSDGTSVSVLNKLPCMLFMTLRFETLFPPALLQYLGRIGIYLLLHAMRLKAERFQGTFLSEATWIRQLPIFEDLLALLLSTLTLIHRSECSRTTRSSHLAFFVSSFTLLLRQIKSVCLNTFSLFPSILGKGNSTYFSMTQRESIQNKSVKYVSSTSS